MITSYKIFESQRIPNIIYWMNMVWNEISKINNRTSIHTRGDYYHSKEYSEFSFSFDKDIKKILIRKLKHLGIRLLKVNIYLGYYMSEDSHCWVVFKSLYTQRVKPDKLVYHCSSIQNRESIKKHGLIPKGWSESEQWGTNSFQIYLAYPPAVFATNKGLEDIWRKNEDIWEIDTEGLPNKWWFDLNFYGDNDDYQHKHIMTFEPIPPENLKLVRKVYDNPEFPA